MPDGVTNRLAHDRRWRLCHDFSFDGDYCLSSDRSLLIDIDSEREYDHDYASAGIDYFESDEQMQGDVPENPGTHPFQCVFSTTSTTHNAFLKIGSLYSNTDSPVLLTPAVSSIGLKTVALNGPMKEPCLKLFTAEQRFQNESALVALLEDDDIEAFIPDCHDDLYFKRLVRYEERSEMAACLLCRPVTWFDVKKGLYKRHMQYAHGISPCTGRPFALPAVIETGRVCCGVCQRWIDLCDEEDKDARLKWWYHAARCRQ
jgi:hypothetical protein